MEEYRRVEAGMHWTIRYALHERTLLSLLPAAEGLLTRFGYHGVYPLDTAAAIAVADLSAVLHSAGFVAMEEEGKKHLLRHLLQDVLQH